MQYKLRHKIDIKIPRDYIANNNYGALSPNSTTLFNGSVFAHVKEMGSKTEELDDVELIVYKAEFVIRYVSEFDDVNLNTEITYPSASATTSNSKVYKIDSIERIGHANQQYIKAIASSFVNV
jgi:hypothetical protein